MTKKIPSILLTLIGLTLFAWGAYTFYERFLCPMRIGVMTQQGDAEWLAYKEAAAGTAYSVHRITKEEMAAAPLENYDILFLRGMGWQPTDEEIANVEKAKARGTAVYVAASTRKSTSDLNNLPEETQKKIGEYLSEGDVENLRSMFRYIARELKGHRVTVPEVVKKPKQGYFHLEAKLYEKLEDYEKHLDALYPNLPKNAPRIVLTGVFLNAYDTLERKAVNELIEQLASKGMRVYCVMGFGGLQMLEDCKPDAAVLFPMGRMAGKDQAIELLSRLNIPCFDAINLMEQKNAWLAEPTAMSGGYMGQAVVMPELDGIIEPTAVAAMETNEEGITLRMPISSRIDMLARRISNWIKLKRMPNGDKKVAVVYYKAPGHSALAASGMETIDSLYNTLCRMKEEGYHLGENFPASAAELGELLQQQGRTIGQWAVGTMEEFIETGHPEFVPAEDYMKWLESDVPEENRKALFTLWGNAPGKQMTIQKDGRPYLLVTRVRLGNVVLMPQPSTAIIGDDADDAETTDAQRSDEMTAVHGTDQAPPHFYLGAYLWVRHGFKADALMHFGTHGSLEFTKGKSAVLSDNCWPTILIGDLPHVYPYIINNIGEAMVAKRRSSAVMVTHLTPPFTKSELYGDLDQLRTKLLDYNTVEGDSLKEEILKSVTELVRANDLFKEIGYRVNPPEAENENFRLPEDKLEVLEEYLEEVQYADITDGLHVIGREWSEPQVQDTVRAMLGDRGTAQINDVRASGKINGIPKENAEALSWFIREVTAGNITREQVMTVEKKPEEENEKEKIPENGERKEPLEQKPETGGISEELKESGKTDTEKPKDATEEKKSGAAPPESGMGNLRPDGKGNGTEGMTDMMRNMGKNMSEEDREKMREMMRKRVGEGGGGMPGTMPQGMKNMPQTGGGEMAEMMRGMMSAPSLEPKNEEPEDKPLALFDAVDRYSRDLKGSIPGELDTVMAALGGGYVKPSSGGDPIINPDAVPTGRNMASVNIEQTPTEEAYQIAKKLTDEIIEDYRNTHDGAYPRRIACTFWGGEYIRTRGVVLAQGLYLMGLRLRRDSRNVVYDVEVIPSEELGRPRIDIVVQTSGQFRDAAGSRIELLDKAVIKVSELPEEKHPNFVKQNSQETELTLKKQGVSASQAREYSTARIFGSPTGNYGTGIMGNISRSETDESGEVADRYIQNMGGMYRSGKVWGVPVQGLFEAQLQGTDLMIQSRSSNTWGPLSLDHVYEFNTLALAVREKTGTDPGVWFSDLRNSSRPRAVTAMAAIREEARTTMWNPKYIKGLQNEGASGAAALVEPVRNMQGWNYIQPDTIDASLWDETYRVYVEDKHNLDMKAYFEEKSPYALQDLTAVMLETIRKGMWQPSDEVMQNLAALHIEMVEKHGAGCSAETCGNAKLHAFLGTQAAGNVSLEAYQSALAKVLESRLSAGEKPEVEGMKLEETTITLQADQSVTASAPFFLSILVLLLSGMLFGGFLIFRKP
ncbi:MAG: cobaltochelatase subunit CobN [Planctomycetaceae bacterium]|jgi:cobaltochelatase CobN|nr:cobaltochelatase subunit CobN [Planctomycetaceae bacterium]